MAHSLWLSETKENQYIVWRRGLLQAKRKCTTRLLPLAFVTGTTPASALRWPEDSQRPWASPSSAQIAATRVPLFAPGSVLANSAAGLEAKKLSTLWL